MVNQVTFHHVVGVTALLTGLTCAEPVGIALTSAVHELLAHVLHSVIVPAQHGPWAGALVHRQRARVLHCRQHASTPHLSDNQLSC